MLLTVLPGRGEQGALRTSMARARTPSCSGDSTQVLLVGIQDGQQASRPSGLEAGTPGGSG
ncbi:hypothetical protein ABZ864_47260 [Streptomyces sp. NPDC047082]|uniref:hypothetical protein n=1 Tax=Streptomyces sp. NPDC047082 TaxID=3155259 RepID=UPI00340F10E2